MTRWKKPWWSHRDWVEWWPRKDMRFSRPPIFMLCFGKWPFFWINFWAKEKLYLDQHLPTNPLFLLEIKRIKLYSLPMHQEDEIMTALESAMKKIEANLEKLEKKKMKGRRFSNNSEERYWRSKRRDQLYWTTTQWWGRNLGEDSLTLWNSISRADDKIPEKWRFVRRDPH